MDQFQSSPGPWAECNTLQTACRGGNCFVSILTRPVGRVQPSGCTVMYPPSGASFNPHPTRGPSATCYRKRTAGVD